MSSEKMLNVAVITTLNNWQETLLEYHKLHRDAASVFSVLNFVFMSFILILSTVSGALTLLDKDTCNSSSKTYFAIGIMNLTVSTLTIIYNVFDISQLLYQHKDSSGEFQKIRRTILLNLTLYESERFIYKNIQEFLKQCYNDINRALEDAPNVPFCFNKKLQTISNAEIGYNELRKSIELVQNEIKQTEQNKDKSDFNEMFGDFTV